MGCLVGAVMRVRVELRRRCEAWVQGQAGEGRAVSRALLREMCVGGVVQLVLDGLCGVRVSGLRNSELGGQNGCNFLKRLS